MAEDIPPLITLEEHFFTSTLTREPASYSEQFKHIPGLGEKLFDLGQLRLKHMDAGKVSLQVISHAPMLAQQGPEACASANDQLAAATKAHPSRFAGFAVLAMGEPTPAAAELRRCVEELGFVGALVDNHVQGEYYEGPEYDVFWQAAVDLDVPVYLHPTWQLDTRMGQFSSEHLTAGAVRGIASGGFGWHADVHVHVLRLFAAGVFDRYPRLKIIVGHFGEMLPFMLDRVAQLSVRWGSRQRDFATVYRENIWITTSGVWSVDPLATVLRNTPIDHILYSVDYPFAKNEDGLKWVEALMNSGLLRSREQLEQICYKNAQTLLRLQVARE